MHVGSVMVFQPPDDGFDYDRLVSLISARIAFVPRYRQRVREVPGRLANPVWVDDEDFDVTYHVRRSALPRPGSDEQLQEFVARIQPRPLDRQRPLWEVYLVEGLAEGRFAVVTKSHQALVDGIHAVDIAHVIVDGDPDREVPITDTWRPAKEPSDVELLTGAVVDAVRRPSEVVDTVRGGVADVQAVGSRLLSTVGTLAATVAAAAARPAPTSPLNVEIGAARRWVMVGHDLDDYRKVRARLGRGALSDDVTVNDVVLATIAGGPARLAADPRRGRHHRHHGAGDGAGQRLRRRRPRPSRQPGHRLLRRPAGRRAAAADAAAPGRLRDASADGGRPGGRGRVPRRPRRVRAADAALARRPARQRDVAAAVQRRHHQRARPAGPALRRRRPDALDLPRHAAGPRAGAVDRADVLRRWGLLRAQRRPRRDARPRRPGPVPRWTRSPSWSRAGSRPR